MRLLTQLWGHCMLAWLCILCTCSTRTTSRRNILIPYTKVHRALLDYKEIHGNLDIPHRFTVPNDSSWHESTHGLNLGACVYRIRRRNLYVEHHKELTSLGFKWKGERSLHFEHFLDALHIYDENMGNLRVPSDYVIGEANDCINWPDKFIGMKLGNKVDDTRRRKIFKSDDQRKQLDSIGFKWKIRDRRGFNEVFLALQTFKMVYGHMRIPKNYVVPESEQWPAELHGLKLYQRVSHIRNRGDFAEHRHRLDEIGFCWDAWKNKEFRDILSGLEMALMEGYDDFKSLDELEEFIGH